MTHWEDCNMKDNNDLINDLVDVDELIEEISSLEKTLKEKLIEVTKGLMAWARLKYVDGSHYHNERMEFSDFYFELKDILEELYSVDKYRVSEIINLRYKVERAYADLLWGIVTSINYDSLDNEQLKLF